MLIWYKEENRIFQQKGTMCKVPVAKTNMVNVKGSKNAMHQVVFSQIHIKKPQSPSGLYLEIGPLEGN